MALIAGIIPADTTSDNRYFWHRHRHHIKKGLYPRYKPSVILEAATGFEPVNNGFAVISEGAKDYGFCSVVPRTARGSQVKGIASFGVLSPVHFCKVHKNCTPPKGPGGGPERDSYHDDYYDSLAVQHKGRKY